jgi:ribulose-phosphate 3-epimerase
MGLTLSHTRAHIWRALMEATCFGTRACIEALAKAGHTCDEIVVAGGATRSDLWLQMHSDISGKPIQVCENADAPLLGSAILACVGVGIHDSVQDAVRAMVRTAKRIEPSPETAETYSNIYSQIYSKVAKAARPVSHAIANVRNQQEQTVSAIANVRDQKEQTASAVETGVQLRGGANVTVISPSLLGCDWSTIKEEVHRCINAGAKRFHVDVFDGVFLYSPRALTFGPQMVDAIRRSCDSCQQTGEKATLDLHMCVYRPARYVVPMAEAGADRFIFQWEAMGSVDDAIHLAREIVDAGMKCGISLNPKTDVQEIYPLLEAGLLDVVDLLAVEPGFGGQKFQQSVLEKIQVLRQRIIALSLQVDIMVDGGVNDKTARDIIAAGADVLVSGSFLFKHPEGIERGIAELLAVDFSQ